MKPRFNWAFELLEAKVHSATNNYTRGAAPDRERSTLIASLKGAIEEARQRQQEFEGHEQYYLFLEDYIGIVQGFLDDAKQEDNLNERLEKLGADVTRLDDTVRAALR